MSEFLSFPSANTPPEPTAVDMPRYRLIIKDLNFCSHVTGWDKTYGYDKIEYNYYCGPFNFDSKGKDAVLRAKQWIMDEKKLPIHPNSEMTGWPPGWPGYYWLRIVYWLAWVLM